MTKFARFVAAGGINAVFSYAVIFSCMYAAKLSPELSNILGYCLGLLMSYGLHRFVTFRSTKSPANEFARFTLVFIFAFLVNLVTLILLTKYMNIHPGVGQVIAGLAYIATAYLLNKTFVFSEQS